jgi:DNA-binding HxlR family transcriptional regulator
VRGILIVRDAHSGLVRFDQFRKSLGIAPTMLTRRLAALAEQGLLEKRRHSERPGGDEYVLTAAGREILPVLFMTEHRAATLRHGKLVRFLDAETGTEIKAIEVDYRRIRCACQARHRPRKVRSAQNACGPSMVRRWPHGQKTVNRRDVRCRPRHQHSKQRRAIASVCRASSSPCSAQKFNVDSRSTISSNEGRNSTRSSKQSLTS